MLISQVKRSLFDNVRAFATGRGIVVLKDFPDLFTLDLYVPRDGIITYFRNRLYKIKSVQTTPTL
jgi:hypothetical protein